MCFPHSMCSLPRNCALDSLGQGQMDHSHAAWALKDIFAEVKAEAGATPRASGAKSRGRAAAATRRLTRIASPDRVLEQEDGASSERLPLQVAPADVGKFVQRIRKCPRCSAPKPARRLQEISSDFVTKKDLPRRI